MPTTADSLREELTRRLLALQAEDGHWEGELSSSALATAVAVVALRQADGARHAALVQAGVAWLTGHQNADGGWGDTPDSPSNLSTTLLVWSALSAGPSAPAVPDAAERWITAHAGGLAPERIAAAVLAHYGNDRTFSAPILTLCALAGRLGPEPAAWQHVPQLPFELAVLPQGLFRFVGLPVVSYALPALIAIGLVRHRRAGRGCPLRCALRTALTKSVLRRLQRIQPENGGFLEATPLTGFVLLSLAGAGCGDHPVAQKCAAFIAESARPDGSWPIDTHLATWVTTLAVKALAGGGSETLARMPRERRLRLAAWLRAQQHTVRHPYTGAAPGGWAWTPRPGGVPDADDTAGAIVALHLLGTCDSERDPRDVQADREAIDAGLKWLAGLQNRDNGIPTFCRGWGKLPFDRSCPDITAHSLQALGAQPGSLRSRHFARLIYLEKARRADGAWLPLWFGNQAAPGRENPVYGTAQVVQGMHAFGGTMDVWSVVRWRRSAEELAFHGLQSTVDCCLKPSMAWLIQAQNPDGGWGGAPGVPSTWEETGVALSALASVTETPDTVLARGVDWLLRTYAEDPALTPAPIGLYFQALWYSERLYPLVFVLQALYTLTARQWRHSVKLAPQAQKSMRVG